MPSIAAQGAPPNGPSAEHPSVPDPARGGKKAGETPVRLFGVPEKAAIYVSLLAVLVLLMGGLVGLVAQSARMYEVGIEIARDAYLSKNAAPSAMARRVFLLASAHEIVTFKAAALGIATIIVVLGGLFVLKGVEAAYEVDGGADFWKGSIKTSSPGLVMVTFGCALVGWTLNTHLSVVDPSDGPGEASSPSKSSSTDADLDELARKVHERPGDAPGPPPPPTRGDSAKGDDK